MSSRRTRTRSLAPSTSAEPSTARRSERLRRRRLTQQQSPAGLSTPGSYSIYKNAFVVASESTLHPDPYSATPSSPAIAEDDSRRVRRRKPSAGLPRIPETPTGHEGHTVGTSLMDDDEGPMYDSGHGKSYSGGTSLMNTPGLSGWASGGLRSARKVAKRLRGLFYSPSSPNSDRSEMEEVVDGDDEIAVDTSRGNGIQPTQLFSERSSNGNLRKALFMLVSTLCALTFFALFFPAVQDEASTAARTNQWVADDPSTFRSRFRHSTNRISIPNPFSYARRMYDAMRNEGSSSAGITMDQLRAFEKRILDEAKQAAADEAAFISRNAASRSSINAGGSDIEAATRKMIELYEADKGAKPDYALLSAGARVLESNPSHVKQYAQFFTNYASSLLTQSMFAPTAPKPPTVAFTPGTTPGECWSFPGDHGSVTVRLARPIVPTGFTMEHTPASSAFSIKSAPRIFRVVGLDLTSRQGVLLGQWEYKNGEGYGHMQSWEVESSEIPIRAVRLEILSNYRAEFTCLYRFRVHGTEIRI